MGSSARAAAASLVVAAALSACSSSSSKPSASATSTAPINTTAPARSVPVSFTELAARIVTKVPAGFVLQPNKVGDTGPSDLAKAIRDDGSPDAGKVYRAEGFVRGYQQLWVGPQQAQIIVILYQFKSATGARQDYARTVRGFNAKPPPGEYKFTVPGLPSSQALGTAGIASDGAGSIIFFTTGVFSLEIDCNGPKVNSLVKALQARATSIADDQFSRL